MDIGISIDKYGVIDISDTPMEGVITATVLSVMVEKNNWWQSPAFGSKIHTLAREKLTNDSVRLVKNYLKEATNWLTQLNIASKIEIEVERRGRDRINYAVTVWQGNKPVVFKNYIGVGVLDDFYKYKNVYDFVNIYNE
ncbi:MAG: phage GP46 family protein [Deferribacteraceae bacterium]|jgi:phage gp46-like protein|nr:phage GP46 family protein [Deferribacteraceae bacterium]